MLTSLPFTFSDKGADNWLTLLRTLDVDYRVGCEMPLSRGGDQSSIQSNTEIFINGEADVYCELSCGSYPGIVNLIVDYVTAGKIVGMSCQPATALIAGGFLMDLISLTFLAPDDFLTFRLSL